MKNICQSARGLNKKMSKKATAVLITALIAVIAATCVGVAYVMVNEGSDLTLDGAGDGFADPARIERLLPGQSYTQEYTAKAPKSAVLTISLTGGHSPDLSGHLNVTIVADGKQLYDGNYLYCRGVIYTAEVSGDVTFSVTYTLPQDADNSAQGKSCSITAHCTLQEKDS